ASFLTLAPTTFSATTSLGQLVGAITTTFGSSTLDAGSSFYLFNFFGNPVEEQMNHGSFTAR
ncbi:unnamed protein product, partial [Ceratitis capitata]